MVREKSVWYVAALVMALVALIAVWSPGNTAAESHETPTMEGKVNHFKCYPILDWAEWEPRVAKLRDQFGISEARVRAARLAPAAGRRSRAWGTPC